MVTEKIYLGDGVYGILDQYGAIVLTTENGFHVTNTIVLEPYVVDSLLAWIKEFQSKAKELKELNGD